MADRTESSIVIAAPPAAVLAVVTDFERYPEWAKEVKQVTILERRPDGLAQQVRFDLDAGAIRDTYSLDYTWTLAGDGTGTMAWSLLESKVLRALDGSYRLTAGLEPGTTTSTSTEVTYTLSVDLRIPMLGMLRRKAEKAIIDTALSELKKRVESAA